MNDKTALPMNRAAIAILCALTLNGCAPWTYVRNEGTRWKSGRLCATLPRDWSRYNSAREPLCLTKDGRALQLIRITMMSIKKELPRSRKKINRDMLPQEIADAIVNEWSLDKNMSNFEVSRNAPADIAGTKGFVLNYSFSTADFLKYSAQAYGFILDDYVYIAAFTATSQHYFDRDRPAFDAFIASLKAGT